MNLLRLALSAALPLAAASSSWAQAPDPNLGRNLAATCANCHGTQGAARGEMPVLAGVPAERTISMMGAYRQGAGSPTVMHQIARGYTDAQVRAIAEFLAAQRPAR